MSLSDDEVVGSIFNDCCNPDVLHRDLDKEIQDRLRAAEKLAEAVRNREAFCKCEPGYSCGEPTLESERIEELRAALAAYEATFTKEADT